MSGFFNKKQIGKLEFKIIVVLFSILGVLLGSLMILEFSVNHGFYVNQNIEGDSMYPTLTEESKILYISDEIKKIERGDIVHANVSIHGNLLIHERTKEPLIVVKRVVGLPHETISIDGNEVYINGLILDEPYAYYDEESHEKMTWTLGDDEYVILGDNRMHSGDSREFDVSTSTSILGVALLIR